MPRGRMSPGAIQTANKITDKIDSVARPPMEGLINGVKKIGSVLTSKTDVARKMPRAGRFGGRTGRAGLIR